MLFFSPRYDTFLEYFETLIQNLCNLMALIIFFWTAPGTNDVTNFSTKTGQTLLQRSGNIMSESTGTHSNVLTSLPGMSTEKFIHHSTELMNCHTNSDYFDDNSECSLFNNGSSTCGSSVSSNESLQDDLSSSSTDDISETIRLVRESAISTRNRNHEDAMEDDDENILLRIGHEENRTADQHSDSESSTSESSVNYLTTRRICDNNIKNVLKGKQVRFPTDNNAEDGTRIEDRRGTLETMTRHFTKGVDFTPEDNCLLDLYQLMQSCNAPRGTFDKVVEWAHKHSGIISTRSLRKRKTIMAIWMQKYGGDISLHFPLYLTPHFHPGKK